MDLSQIENIYELIPEDSKIELDKSSESYISDMLTCIEVAIGEIQIQNIENQEKTEQLKEQLTLYEQDVANQQSTIQDLEQQIMVLDDENDNLRNQVINQQPNKQSVQPINFDVNKIMQQLSNVKNNVAQVNYNSLFQQIQKVEQLCNNEILTQQQLQEFHQKLFSEYKQFKNDILTNILLVDEQQNNNQIISKLQMQCQTTQIDNNIINKYNDQIQQLQNELKNQQQINSYNNKVKLDMSDIMNIKEQCQLLSQNVNQVKQQNTLNIQLISQHINDIINKVGTVSDNKQQVNTNNNQELQLLYDQTIKQYNEMVQKFKHLQLDNNVKNQEINNIKQQYQELQNQYQLKCEDYVFMQQSLNQEKRKSQVYEEIISQTEDSSDEELALQTNDNQQNTKSLLQKLIQCQEQIQQFHNKIQEQEQILSNFEQKTQEQHSLLEEQQYEQVDVKRIIKIIETDLHNKILQLTDKNDNLNLQVLNINKNQQLIQQQNCEYSQQIINLQDALKVFQNDCDQQQFSPDNLYLQKINQLQNENKQLSETNNQIEKQLKQIENTNQPQIKHYQDDISLKNEQITQMNQQINELNITINQNNIDIQTKQNKIEQLNCQNNQYTTKQCNQDNIIKQQCQFLNDLHFDKLNNQFDSQIKDFDNIECTYDELKELINIIHDDYSILKQLYLTLFQFGSKLIQQLKTESETQNEECCKYKDQKVEQQNQSPPEEQIAIIDKETKSTSQFEIQELDVHKQGDEHAVQNQQTQHNNIIENSYNILKSFNCIIDKYQFQFSNQFVKHEVEQFLNQIQDQIQHLVVNTSKDTENNECIVKQLEMCKKELLLKKHDLKLLTKEYIQYQKQHQMNSIEQSEKCNIQALIQQYTELQSLFQMQFKENEQIKQQNSNLRQLINELQQYKLQVSKSQQKQQKMSIHEQATLQLEMKTIHKQVIQRLKEQKEQNLELLKINKQLEQDKQTNELVNEQNLQQLKQYQDLIVVMEEKCKKVSYSDNSQLNQIQESLFAENDQCKQKLIDLQQQYQDLQDQYENLTIQQVIMQNENDERQNQMLQLEDENKLLKQMQQTSPEILMNENKLLQIQYLQNTLLQFCICVFLNSDVNTFSNLQNQILQQFQKRFIEKIVQNNILDQLRELFKQIELQNENTLFTTQQVEQLKQAEYILKQVYIFSLDSIKKFKILQNYVDNQNKINIIQKSSPKKYNLLQLQQQKQQIQQKIKIRSEMLLQINNDNITKQKKLVK